MGSRANAAVNRHGSTRVAGSNRGVNSGMALSRTRNFSNIGGTNNSIGGNSSLNNGAIGTGGLGSAGIRNFNSNFFGLGGNGNSGYGYGNGGYGYGNRGYGYGGYGYPNSRYVMAFVPGVGWVRVPIWAIRRF
jgi:hypothetical protein